jgi:hypothetical protein
MRLKVFGVTVPGPLEVLAWERRMLAQSIQRSVRTVTALGLPVFGMPFIWSLITRLDPGVPGTHPFLSPEWIEAARKIREDFRGKPTTTPPAFRINHVVTDVPFGEGTLQAHTDTTSGDLEMDLGHIENPDVTVTIPYETAKAVLVNGDVQAAMQAFMSGQIKVDGDISKLMALQTAQVDPVALEAATRIKEITA